LADISKIDPKKDVQNVTGSLPYLAPELYLGGLPTRSSDFYALGVMLYRLCTGSFPYTLDQINALITGGHQYFIPLFPSELNKNISLELEKLILRLLERNPENRFHSGEEIIAYINRIHQSEYPFSSSWSAVNNIRFNSYLVREKYSHQILDFVPALNSSNGKVISVIGGDGLGKDSILSLFRYHLLGGEYFLFDYTCSRTDHEAFFALIKEYIHSLSDEAKKHYEVSIKASPKLRSYLFSSEQEAKGISQSAEDLREDFASVRDLIIQLAELKPIIFIIRNFQHVTRHTIDFLNFISPFLVQQRIMIVLSCNDFNRIKLVEHTVMINIPFLSSAETSAYISKLLPVQAPQSLINDINLRSSGNPHFIREILIDLVTHNNIILKGNITFPEHLENYNLPNRLLQSVYYRMSRLTQESYQALQKLSIIRTPMTQELMGYILKLKDTDLYNLLSDATYNEILVKQDKLYRFSFQEARDRLINECNDADHVKISQRLLKYFEKKDVVDKDICRGLIANSLIAVDLSSARKYYLKLSSLLSEDYEQADAYEAMLNVLKLDFDPRTMVSTTEIISDLVAFQEKTELTGFFDKAGFILDNADVIPELFEKYHTIGTIQFLREETEAAKKSYQQAEQLTMTGKQQLTIWLAMVQVYLKTDLDSA
ncbi:MAG TPA: hypothetical protein PKI59_04240, partial [Candidatus Cloacimonadota bacterium]|nr:hypothetical protein [Candidatus Cloacimonadota bacterium]